MKKYSKIILIMLFTFMFDILSKLIVDKILELGNGLSIIDNFFYLTKVYNYGAAWNILNNKSFLLSLISVIALIIIIVMIKKEKKLTKINNIYYGLILGGIIGNLSNRLFLGYVIDFLDFNIFGYNYPIFNLADCAIVISIVLMIIEAFRGDKNVRS